VRSCDCCEIKNDVMCYHAVVYNIMIIGEAANMLTKEFRNTHQEIHDEKAEKKSDCFETIQNSWRQKTH